MPLKGKYLQYRSEITFEIFKLIWDKLIECGWKNNNENNNYNIDTRYKEFKSGNYYLLEYKEKIFATHTIGSSYKMHPKKTNVQEILGYDPFVKEFVFPEKWYVRVSDKNVKDIQLFKSKSNWSDNAAKYKAVGYEGVGYNSLPENYTEITFDQFQKYVLKGIVEMPEVKEVIPKSIEKWSVGTYVLFLKNLGDFRAGHIDIITDKFDGSCTFLEKYLSMDIFREKGGEIKWFATKSEAEKFAKTLVEPVKRGNGILDRIEPKQPLKQAVHCKTQEEYKFAKETLGATFNSNAYIEGESIIPLDAVGSTITLNRFGHSIYNDYNLLSFQEWCDLNGYKMEKEVKCNQKFKVGDFVIVTDEVLKSAWSRKKESVGYIMQIPKSVYNIQGFNNGDATSGICPTNKFGINYEKKWIRHATPEEINNHLISIGQIPAEKSMGEIAYEEEMHDFFNSTVESERNYDYTVNPKYKQEFNIINKTKTIKF